jgi:hypothetical protein
MEGLLIRIRGKEIEKSFLSENMGFAEILSKRT